MGRAPAPAPRTPRRPPVPRAGVRGQRAALHATCVPVRRVAVAVVPPATRAGRRRGGGAAIAYGRGGGRGEGPLLGFDLGGQLVVW